MKLLKLGSRGFRDVVPIAMCRYCRNRVPRSECRRRRRTRSKSFYRGKTVTIIVGSAVGGGFDAYARLVGHHLGRFIPGNPTVIVQNIPGAGSNKAASYVALQAPKDGTVIGAVQAIAITQPLISDQPVPHDPRNSSCSEAPTAASISAWSDPTRR